MTSPVPSGTGYDLPIGVNQPGWCADNDIYLSPGSYSPVYFYTSLSSANWPAGMPFSLGKIAQVNWMFNNLGLWGMSFTSITDSQGLQIQDAVWEILCPPFQAPTGSLAESMANAASTHSTYMPMTGGWAAVIMAVNDLPAKFQLVFTVVDP